MRHGINSPRTLDSRISPNEILVGLSKIRQTNFIGPSAIGLFAQLAASVALTCGRISTRISLARSPGVFDNDES
jgi:hypothetical protein